MKNMALMIIVAGCMLIVVGLAFVLAGKFPFLGRLPGDIHVQGKQETE